MKTRLQLGAISSAIFISQLAFSQEAALETIVIIGDPSHIASTDVAGSIDVISFDELAYEHVDDTIELFNKAPGVALSRFNQGIINSNIAIRGFAGDGVTPHATLLIDGAPAIIHNGFIELDQIFPLNIANIEVFKGNSDPRYGLFNIAGNFNVSTRQDIARQLEVTLGSFDTQEIQAYAGFEGKNVIHNYAIGYRNSEGYRDNTDLEKYALSGSWEWQLNNNQSLRLIARHAGYDGDAPGYLTQQQARENPRQSASFASEDGGDKQTSHFSANWSKDYNSGQLWNIVAYTNLFERERWVRFSEAGSLQNRFDDQTHWGITSTLSIPLTSEWELSWGADYQFQDIIEQRFGTVGQQRVRDVNNVIRDFDYDYINYGSYLKIAHEPTAKLRWNFALRADRIDGDFTNVTTQEDRDAFDFGTILQPKFNIVFEASPSVNLFANVGRSFQHPFSSSAYTSGDTSAQDVSINNGWEIGTQWSPSQYINARISYWQQNADDELVTVDGIQQNVGETEREGVELAFNGVLTDMWSFWGNLSTVDTEIVRTSDNLLETQGNSLRGIPEFTASVGINYQINPKLTTRLHLDAQGDYYVNEANLGGKFGDYTLLNFTADYATSWGAIKFQLNNLTDEFYEYVFDFGNAGTATIHSPGDGINGSISVSWNL